MMYFAHPRYLLVVNSTHCLGWSTVVASVLFTLPVPAYAATLLNETFTAGSSATIGNPSGAAAGTSGAGVLDLPNSTQWFLATSNNGTALYDVAQGTLRVNNSVSLATLAYFATGGSPQPLAIGDRLTVQMRFTLQAPLGNNPLRVAVLNSGDSQISSNTSTNPSSNIYSSYRGFMASFNASAATAKPTIYRRNGIAGDATYASLINTLTSGGTPIWTSLADSGTAAPGLTVDNLYQATLTVVRSAGNTMSVSFEIRDLATSGSPVVPAYSVSGTSSTGNTEAFDTVVVNAGSTATASFTVSRVTIIHTPAPPPAVAAPTFNPAAGIYASAQSVSIGCATSGATIRFTTDGTEPTASSGTLYTQPVAVTATTTLKAIACAAGMSDSAVASASYTIDPFNVAATPTFSLGSGTYTGAQSVTIATTTPNATLRYTTDGSAPSSSSGTLYTAPVVVSADLVLKAIACASGTADSAVATASYTIVDPPPAPPIITEPLTMTQNVFAGHAVQLSASVSGFPAPEVVWQISTDAGATWTSLSDDTTYSGTATRTLTIAVSASLDGSRFRYVATNASGSVVSNATTLDVAPAPFLRPISIAVDAAGNLFVGDEGTSAVKKIDASGRVHDVGTSIGRSVGADVQRFHRPAGLAWDGVLFVADSGSSTLLCVLSDDDVITLAGAAGVNNFRDGAGEEVWFNAPSGVAMSSTDQIYVADSFNHVIRRVTLGGAVTTFAGTPGSPGANDGAGAAARFRSPGGVAVAGNGTIYVADTENHTIRKITRSGTVTTLAGLPLTTGSADGAGNVALFSQPRGIAVDGLGNVYVADTGNSTIRKITPSGVVTTFAGLAGMAGFADGTGVEASFNLPSGLAIDRAGNLYVADTGNAAIRKITLGAEVTTLALTPGDSAPSSRESSNMATVESRGETATGEGGGGSLSGGSLAALAAALALRAARRRRVRPCCFSRSSGRSA